MRKVYIKALIDCFSIPFIISCAYALKFKLGWGIQYLFDVSYGIIYKHAQIEPYLQNIYLVISIWIISFYFMGVYRTYSGLMAEVDEFVKVVKGVTLASVLLLVISNIYNIMPASRMVMFYGWLVGPLILSFTRIVINRLWGTPDTEKKSACILGADKQAQELTERLLLHKQDEITYKGNFAKQVPDTLIYAIQKPFIYLGGPDKMEAYLIEENIDKLFISDSSYSEKQIENIITFCEWHNIQVFIHYETPDALGGVSQFEDMGGLPIITYKTIAFNKKAVIIKRIIDVSIASIALIVLSPLIIGIICWIKWVSPKGSVFFVQERVGKDGALFQMMKFRTMHDKAEESTGPVWVSKEDGRLIKGGKWLRRFSLDELPQLINIMKNEMTLVGPRPERPFFVDQIEKETPYFKLRHKVKGGLTGWAQINGRAYLTNKPLEKFRYDLFYIKNWSLVLDIKIMLKTVFTVLKGEEAY